MAHRALTVLIVALGCLLASAQFAIAGTVFGIIRLGAQPAANADVALTCGGPPIRTRTDARGTYRLTVPGTGRCTLNVGSASTAVVVYDEPLRYDFAIVGNGPQSRLVRQ